MNILYGTNDSYCEQTATSMRSVFEHNREEDIRVYLLCEGVSEQNKAKMCSVAKGFPNVEILCRDPAAYLEPLKQAFRMQNWRGSFVQYIYACIAEAFPELDRILWLDGDVICCSSLRPLWETEMGACCLAAALDCTPFLALKRDCAFRCTPFYFNAGVLLFDLRNCREHALAARCRQVLRGYAGKLLYRDQTMLNLALPPQLVRRLDLRWNYPAGLTWEALQEIARKNSARKPTFSLTQLQHARADLRLLHFIGGGLPCKPWFVEYASPQKAEYLKYRALTPWAQSPLARWQDGSVSHAVEGAFSRVWDTPFMAGTAALYDGLLDLSDKLRGRG